MNNTPCPHCKKHFATISDTNKHITASHKRKPFVNRKNKSTMKNITIYFPDIYDDNIQKLIKMKLLPSRSEAIRTALHDFLSKEYTNNLDLLGFWNKI